MRERGLSKKKKAEKEKEMKPFEVKNFRPMRVFPRSDSSAKRIPRSIEFPSFRQLMYFFVHDSGFKLTVKQGKLSRATKYKIVTQAQGNNSNGGQHSQLFYAHYLSMIPLISMTLLPSHLHQNPSQRHVEMRRQRLRGTVSISH